MIHALQWMHQDTKTTINESLIPIRRKNFLHFFLKYIFKFKLFKTPNFLWINWFLLILNLTSIVNCDWSNFSKVFSIKQDIRKDDGCCCCCWTKETCNLSLVNFLFQWSVCRIFSLILDGYECFSWFNSKYNYNS